MVILIILFLNLNFSKIYEQDYSSLIFPIGILILYRYYKNKYTVNLYFALAG